MHRYSTTASGGSGIGSSGGTGGAGSTANFTPASSRRGGGSQLASYKLKCDKEVLSPRLGPPDYYPPAPNCAEELLSRETAQHGYREVIDGIEEAKETTISFIGNVLLTKDNVSRYKEALRKRLRSVTNALNRKRKAGQVYDVPLSGHLLAKPGCYPERHACSEDFRRKWLEDLSQRKRLATLAEHVPHGIHKKTLFEALIKQNVPFLRATWLIKVLYLNQVRPVTAGNAGDKSQTKRFEQWTKDLLDYVQSVLDEFPSSDWQGSEAVLAESQTKWNYLIRLVQWEYTEGLLQQSQVVDWALRQIQDKDSLEKFERVLPLLLESMDVLSLSQVHVRAVVYICLDWLRQLPQQHHLVVTLVELLRYLLVAVPDTFVAFDCFPLLSCVFTHDGSGTCKEGDATPKNSIGQATGSPYREHYVTEVVGAIEKRAASLIKAVNPGILRTNEGKLIQGLDKSLVAGDVYSAYSLVFDGDISAQEQLPQEWKDFSSSSPFLSSILSSINLSDLYAVRFICEWAVCDFRDTRQKPSRSEKLLGVKDMSRVYMAVSVLCMKKAELESGNKKAKNGGKPVKGRPKGRSRSPGPLHEMMVAWIDQHELRKGEGCAKVHLLLSELVRQGVFHPEAYVRQLLVEGTLEKRESQADVSRAARHRQILRFLPGLPEAEELKDGDDVPESVRLYQNERRLALFGFSQLKSGGSKAAAPPVPASADRKKTGVATVAEVKQAVASYLQIPEAGNAPKVAPPAGTKRSIADVTPGCEDCLKGKRQKTGEAKAWASSEAEDSWWLKKVPKAADPIKMETSVVKPPKQNVRGRPKTVRKTQSLAHLHSARIDGSQGASSSHTCDSRTQCPYHRPGSKAQQAEARVSLRDLRAIGSAIKQLRFPEKCSFSAWINRTVRGLVSSGSSDTKWQLTEERFAVIVYLLDTALDSHSLLKLLIWLLPGKPNLHKDVGEAAILSCLRRYEGVLTSMNLLPEVLTTVMQCASTTMGGVPSGKTTSCSLLLWYVRELLRKYGTLQTVQSWERVWRVSCDQKIALEFEALKSGETDGLGFMGMLGSSLGDDRDDPIPQRLNSRLAKSIGSAIKEIVQKGMGELVQVLTRERDAANPGRDTGNRTDEYVHRVVAGLLESIKQNGNALQADLALINAAVSAVVSHGCIAAANASDMLSGSSGGAENASLRCSRRILAAHVKCLRLLKEAMDDRQSRALEVSLATEASGVVAGVFVHSSAGRAPRSQFHLSPETPEMGVLVDGLTTAASGRVAAATAFVVLAVTQGVVTLERILALLRIKDGLEALHLPKLLLGNANGVSRGSIGGNPKSDNMAEAHIYWFRALVGDCRAVSNGLVGDILGDASVVALARAQRLLPLGSIFTMAYAMFCGLLRRQVLAHMHITSKDGVVQSLTAAVREIIAHEPFRELCLQDTKALYVLFSSDTGSEYAAMLDSQGLDPRTKVEALVPFSARLFLHALLDKKLPSSMQWPDDEAWMDNRAGVDHSLQIVHTLDEIQPATFHWQWLELRLLLNEQVFMEKLEADTAVKALQAVWSSEPMQLSECEKTFTEIVLTRLLGRPDAAALYSEVLFCLGTCKSDGKPLERPLEEYLIMLVKWVLKGVEVLQGRKSLRQHLESYALNKNFPIGTSVLKSWAWQPPGGSEGASLEEGEVSESASWKSAAAASPKDEAGGASSQQFATERALADLALPCLARSPFEICGNFTVDLVAQMTDLEGFLNKSSSGRVLGSAAAAAEAPVTKGQGTRRAARSTLEGGSPGVRRRSAAAEPAPTPISTAALQSSLWLRLQFLLPLLRIVHAVRDTGRNMRLTLAPVLLRLLGTRIVQESHQHQAPGQWSLELSSVAAGEELFDRLLSVLHALLSSTWAVWLKPRPTSKKPPREVPPFDRETAEKMQTELDHMQLPRSIRMRLQAAMPTFPPSTICTLAAAPPQVPLSSFNSLQSSFTAAAASQLRSNDLNNINLKTAITPSTSTMKAAAPSGSSIGDLGVEMDPWLLLEDGTGTAAAAAAAAAGSSSSTADAAAFKACPWLKGAVRVRRSDLTYVGSVDSDT